MEYNQLLENHVKAYMSYLLSSGFKSPANYDIWEARADDEDTYSF